jgi:hypothetical protein
MFFVMKGYMFIKQVNIFQILLQQLSKYFQVQVKPNLTLYICSSCLHNIDEDKTTFV